MTRMIKEHGDNLNKKIASIKEDIGTIKRNQSEIKKTIAEMNNTLEEFKRRLEEADRQINDLEDKQQNTPNCNNRKEKKKKNTEMNEEVRYLWDNIKHNNIHIIGIPEREERG